jgi:thioredoxin reductase
MIKPRIKSINQVIIAPAMKTTNSKVENAYAVRCIYSRNAPSARKPEWTENPTIREEIRQKIKKNPRFMTAIKHITDTNILNGLDQKDQTAETAKTDDYHFHFSGVTTVTKNPLSNSVIYDSDCSQPLTYDKARFVEEITPASE